MADKRLRRNHDSTAFADRLGPVSLKRLDMAVGLVLGAFVVLVVVDTVARGPMLSAYALVSAVHNHVGRFLLVMAVFMFGVGAYIGLLRHADVTPYFRRATYVTLGYIALQASLGAVMYFLMGVRPGEEVHILYGIGAVCALPFFIYVETTSPKRPAMGSYLWGFGLLAGVIIRTLVTGPVS